MSSLMPKPPTHFRGIKLAAKPRLTMRRNSSSFPPLPEGEQKIAQGVSPGNRAVFTDKSRPRRSRAQTLLKSRSAIHPISHSVRSRITSHKATSGYRLRSTAGISCKSRLLCLALIILRICQYTYERVGEILSFAPLLDLCHGIFSSEAESRYRRDERRDVRYKKRAQ